MTKLEAAIRLLHSESKAKFGYFILDSLRKSALYMDRSLNPHFFSRMEPVWTD
jgi:S-adenosylmethionine:diacylglycerol 3-amino-3-carboxypropyl transferase